MQVIARCKRELEAPSDSEERKKLEEQIQGYESLIKNNKKWIKKEERALSVEREALQLRAPPFQCR